MHINTHTLKVSESGHIHRAGVLSNAPSHSWISVSLNRGRGGGGGKVREKEGTVKGKQEE